MWLRHFGGSQTLRKGVLEPPCISSGPGRLLIGRLMGLRATCNRGERREQRFAMQRSGRKGNRSPLEIVASHGDVTSLWASWKSAVGRAVASARQCGDARLCELAPVRRRVVRPPPPFPRLRRGPSQPPAAPYCPSGLRRSRRPPHGRRGCRPPQRRSPRATAGTRRGSCVR